MIYIILFFIGLCEECTSMAYYRLAHKGYKIACAIVSMCRIFLWAFVVQTIFKELNNTFWIILWYALGSAVGDYISLAMEHYVDRVIFKFKRKGRKKRRLYLINERKE